MKIFSVAVLALASTGATRAEYSLFKNKVNNKAQDNRKLGYDYDGGPTCPDDKLRSLNKIVDDYCGDDGLFRLYYGKSYSTEAPTEAPTGKGGKKGGMSMMMEAPTEECNCSAELYAIPTSAGACSGTSYEEDTPFGQFPGETNKCTGPVVDPCSGSQIGITSRLDTITYFEDCCKDPCYGCGDGGKCPSWCSDGDPVRKLGDYDGDGYCDVAGSALVSGQLNVFGTTLTFNGNPVYDPEDIGTTSAVESLIGGTGNTVNGFQAFLGFYCDDLDLDGDGIRRELKEGGSRKLGSNSCGKGSGQEFALYFAYTCDGEYSDCNLDTAEADRLALPICEFPYEPFCNSYGDDS